MKRSTQSEYEMVKKLAEDDLWYFARLVNPERLYGDIHKEVFRFLMKDSDAALLLLPRSHMKSHCVAVWCAWWITKHPETTILYVSSTSTLAEAQLYDIKNILTSEKYSMYWPEMIHPEEGKRECWNNTAISVDHPKRKKEGVRDKTVFAAGLTTTITGLHCEVLVPDDVVAPDNAYTEEGRRKVSSAVSQMASILNTGGIIKACGTRYHPADEYSKWLEQTIPEYNEHGEEIGKTDLWDVMERVVEINQKFLWPRAARDDGKMYGFDRRELDKISAKYTDRTQFYAQYYNDPNDPESNRLDYSRFQYYDRSRVKQVAGNWFIGDKKLNVYAAIDFAYTVSKTSDYTAIVVIGIDQDKNIYVLDIDRFKTDRVATMYERIMLLHERWEFRKLRAEITSAQSMIVQDLKDRFLDNNVWLSIDEHKPNRHQGSKEERIAAILEPRYENMMIWHFKGGHTPALEEELILARPAHDDLKDSLASAVEIARVPRGSAQSSKKRQIRTNRRFGGVQRF